ncbi:ABC transporter permease, partial [[Pasteurella] aerogenes]
MKNITDTSIKYLLILFIIAILSFSILIPDIFCSISNFQSMASQIPVLGILTLTMAVTILTGGINLFFFATINVFFLIISFFFTQFNYNSFICLF